jgi:hypothetical protein
MLPLSLNRFRLTLIAPGQKGPEKKKCKPSFDFSRVKLGCLSVKLANKLKPRAQFFEGRSWVLIFSAATKRRKRLGFQNHFEAPGRKSGWLIRPPLLQKAKLTGASLSLGGSPTHLVGSVTLLPSHCHSPHTRRTVLVSAAS